MLLLTRSNRVERIEHNKKTLAIVVRATDRSEGASFVTEDVDTMQLGILCHPSGKEIQPHAHQVVERRITETQEVLFMRRGRLRVDFYDDDRRYLRSLEVAQGDVLLLLRGGHGFEMLEDCEIIEAKTGPFLGDQDKVRFEKSA